MKSSATARVDVGDDGNENDDDEERRRRRIVMNEVVFCLVQVWTGKAEEMGGGDG